MLTEMLSLTSTEVINAKVIWMQPESDGPEHHRRRSEFIRKLVQSRLNQQPTNDRYAQGTPRTIVQFWHNLRQLPEDVNECIASWTRWETRGLSHRLFDEHSAKAFIGRSLGPRHERAFERCYHPAMQADYFRLCYPHAKFIVIGDVAGASDRQGGGVLEKLEGADVLRLHGKRANTWRAFCEHLRLAPPIAPYPAVRDIGQRRYRRAPVDTLTTRPAKPLRHDRSPWVVEPRAGWVGISASAFDQVESSASLRVRFEDDLADIQPARWLLRNDTFPGNLGLFRPANVILQPSGGLLLAVIEEPLGVRNLSAAAVSSRGNFLFGRFEATLQATNVPGLVTGFFLHRDSPRQEIDVEIAGNRPDRLLVNVFYNPGPEGAKFDYGYRGTPVSIPLGFDASKALHRFTIEWEPCEIRWLVDGELFHRRATWDPTPIPHLPMTLHVNTWPTRSRELAGRLIPRALPASAIVGQIAVDAFNVDAQPRLASASEAISSTSVAQLG